MLFYLNFVTLFGLPVTEDGLVISLSNIDPWALDSRLVFIMCANAIHSMVLCIKA